MPVVSFLSWLFRFFVFLFNRTELDGTAVFGSSLGAAHNEVPCPAINVDRWRLMALL